VAHFSFLGKALLVRVVHPLGLRVLIIEYAKIYLEALDGILADNVDLKAQDMLSVVINSIGYGVFPLQVREVSVAG